MAWDYYKDRQKITEAGVKIITIDDPGQTQKTTIYEVSHLCCGRRRRMSHAHIVKRTKGHIKHCQSCGVKAHKSTKKEVEFFEPWYHGWEPPPSMSRIAKGWMPR